MKTPPDYKHLGEVGAKAAAKLIQKAVDAFAMVVNDRSAFWDADQDSRTAFARAVIEEHDRLRLAEVGEGIPNLEQMSELFRCHQGPLMDAWKAVRNLMLSAFAKQLEEKDARLSKAKSLLIRHHEHDFSCKSGTFCPVCSPDGKDGPFNDVFQPSYQTSNVVKGIRETTAAINEAMNPHPINQAAKDEEMAHLLVVQDYALSLEKRLAELVEENASLCKPYAIASVLLSRQTRTGLQTSQSLHFREHIISKNEMRGIAIESALGLKPGFSVDAVLVEIINYSPPAPSLEEVSRAEFEAAYSEEYLSIQTKAAVFDNAVLARGIDGEYVHYAVQGAFRMWKRGRGSKEGKDGHK